MQVHTNGAQRASGHRSMRIVALAVLASVIAVGGAVADPGPAQAASQVKVVIVVGPVEGSTTRYVRHARSYAALARAHGAKVIEVYSPRATWSRVRSAAKGANIFIYLGHGNGSPSPYGRFSALRRNGMGLNRSSGHGHRNVKYYGQTHMRTGLDLDNNAAVLLNHLCYASGNSEPGRAKPSKSTAMKRADGYGTGFLRAGADAVFANGHGSLSSILTDLLTSDKSVGQIFQDDPEFSGRHDFRFKSRKTPWTTVWMDSVIASQLLPLGRRATHAHREPGPRRLTHPSRDGTRRPVPTLRSYGRRSSRGGLPLSAIATPSPTIRAEMHDAPLPDLVLYARPGCGLCDETRAILRGAARGADGAGCRHRRSSSATSRPIPPGSAPTSRSIPVVELGERRLELATSAAKLRRLLADVLDA